MKKITNCPHCGSDELVDFGEKSSECQTCGKTFLIKPRAKRSK